MKKYAVELIKFMLIIVTAAMVSWGGVTLIETLVFESRAASEEIDL